MFTIEPRPASAMRLPNACVAVNVPTRFTSIVVAEVVGRHVLDPERARPGRRRLVDAGVVDEHVGRTVLLGDAPRARRGR